MTVPVFELLGTTQTCIFYMFHHVFCTCEFNEQRSLFIIHVFQIGTFWSPEQNCSANINAKLV